MIISRKRGEGVNIRIIGAGSHNGLKLKKNVIRAKEEYGHKLNLEIKNDEKLAKKYNIKDIPGFMINDKVISQGKILTVREVLRYINNYASNEA